MPDAATDFIDGWVTMAGNGAAETMSGCAIHLYAANRSMQDRYFYSADGELLIVPQEGRLSIATELGKLDIEPFEIAVIPRGVRFRVTLPDGTARGYICENFGALLRLPDLGPIGSNGLANPRDFQTPHAAYEDREGAFELVAKMNGVLWRADIGHSPLDVVAWHGNYAPYKYDLRHFNTIGSISFDHPDPSIFLVLQSQTDAPGVDARLRDLSAALACGRRYVPAALVSSECRERIHGPRAWRVRREIGRLHAGRFEPAQLHDGTRSRRRDVRKGIEGGYVETREGGRHDGVHVRNPYAYQADPLRTGDRSTAGGLLRMLAGLDETFQPGATMIDSTRKDALDALDATRAPALRSWIESANDSSKRLPDPEPAVRHFLLRSESVAAGRRGDRRLDRRPRCAASGAADRM